MKLLGPLWKATKWGFAALCLVVLLGFGYLWIRSPGQAQPILAADGSVVTGAVSAVETLQVGGVDQHVIMRGLSRDAPVLLVLHGGPGSPAYPFFRARNAGLEDDFIVAYWDQRGAGASFDGAADLSDLTIAQMVEDTADVAAQLASRFDQDKVYLLGHSWGGALAILTARDHPEAFQKVVVVSPVIAQYEAEEQSLAWLKEQADATENDAMLAALNGLGFPVRGAAAQDWMAYLGPQRGWLERSGSGTTHDPISLLGLVGMLAATPEYTLGDKWGYLRGTRASMQQLWPQVVAMDLRDDAPRLDVPLILFQGVHDRVTSPDLTRAYFDALEAPEKALHLFEHSSHSALLEEPDAFNALLRGHATP